MSIFMNKDKTELIVTCGCGGGAGCGDAAHIKINFDDHDYAFISYMNGNFYKDQDGALRTLWWKLKKIWAIIRNKDHYYSDIVMNKEEFETFREYVNSIGESNDKSREN